MAIEKAGVELTAIDNATRVFNQVNAAAKGLEKTYDGLKTTFEAAVGAIALDRIVRGTLEWEAAQNRLNATLKATGGAVGLTRRELEQLAKDLSGSTIFDENDIKSAEANLLKFGNIHEDVFKEALKLSADYAAFTGGSVTAATQAVGRALADPVNGLKALQREFGNLTFTQKEYIAQLEAQGKTEEAQIAVLDILRSRIGGAAQAGNTGLTALLGNLKKAWDEVGEAGAHAFQKLADAQSKYSIIGGLMQGDARMFGPPEPPKPPDWEEGFAQQNARIASMLAKRAEAIDRENEAHAKAIPLLTQWNNLLRQQTNFERAVDEVLKGQARSWNDLDKAHLLAIAGELDLIRVEKERMDLSARYAAALRDETRGEEENLATRVKSMEDAWGHGMRETFQEFVLHAKNGAEQAQFFFRNAFRNMEDALVSFAMTGKLNFHAFAESVISDLIRIQIRQQLAGLASSSAFSGFAGGIGGLFGFAPVDVQSGLISHSGGVIGVDSFPTRSLPAATWAGAPRMHRGGLAGDEVPAILQRGERVIPRGGSAGATFNQVFHIGGDVTTADLASVAAAGKRGAMEAIAEERRRNPNGPFGG